MPGLELFVFLCLASTASITLWRATGNTGLGVTLFTALMSVMCIGYVVIHGVRKALEDRLPPPK